ncbi:MAG: ABC transporter ATP-binding protein [Alphaproteobacteria bacterium]|jgi:ATP-binding cassette, subfamily B, bacterial|nr:ABC transporter ATP-binding protein [Alphaproteobacteria bacterium]MBT5390320.1 ABC transporter ATP-binding protein [Alphaproteobacteria bacterium]
MNKNLLNFYYRVAFNYRRKILLLFLFPVVWCTAETAAPYLIKIIIDDLSYNEGAFSTLSNVLVRPILYYFVLMALMELSIRGCNYLWIKFIPDLRAKFREVILSDVLKKPLVFFQDQQIGELITKYKNLSNSFDLLLASFLYGIFPVFVSSLIALGFLFSISSLFSVFFILWFLGMNLVTFLFAKKSIHFSDEYASSENKLLGHIGDLFRNILVLKTFSGRNIDDRLTLSLQNSEKTRARRIEWITFKADSLRSVISMLMLLAMVGLLGWGWKVGRLTLGDFSFVTATCFYVRRSAWVASVNLLDLFKEIGIATEALSHLSETGNNVTGVLRPSSHSGCEISFDSIRFGYEPQHSLFNNLNLEIPEGQRVLIMGESGSGKTTLMHLLLNLYSLEKGRVLISDEEIAQKNQMDLIEKIAYVPQNTTLFHRSIEDNIRYGNPNSDKTRIREVTKLARADEFIMNLEKNYQTLVGENGVKLSGGQCQRIALARAFLCDSPILILDEATSALDNKMEREILEAIISDTQTKTFIMITHNPTNFDIFDRILFFENGAIKQDVKTDDLPSNWDHSNYNFPKKEKVG